MLTGEEYNKIPYSIRKAWEESIRELFDNSPHELVGDSWINTPVEVIGMEVNTTPMESSSQYFTRRRNTEARTKQLL